LFCGIENTISSALRNPAKPCLKAFWLPGGPDLPRMPAMSYRIADEAGFCL